jgi:uncharacterized membrane protein YkoI
LVAASAYAGSQFGGDVLRVRHGAPLEAYGEHRGMSLDEAAEMVRSRFNARVVRAETQQSDGRISYRFKLLSEDGRVFAVRVDAESGRIY